MSLRFPFAASALMRLWACLLIGLSAVPAPARAATTEPSSGGLPTLKVAVFSAPSQSIWIPTLIQQLGLDKKHGFNLEVTAKPSQVAYTDFASGNDPVCYCAAIAAVARFVQQGADLTLLWNIFDYDAFIVTNVPGIQKPKDIEGRILQADTVTGSWALGSWFLQGHGVSLGKVQVRSSSGHGAASLADLSLNRVDGVLMNATEASSAIVASRQPLHAVALFDADIWRRRSGTDALPAIALGVARRWYADPGNQALARRFYAANLEAVAYIRAHPKSAADLVAAPSKISAAALLDVFTRFPQLIDIRPIAEYRATIGVLTQKLLPEARQLPRALTDAELASYVSDFTP